MADECVIPLGSLMPNVLATVVAMAGGRSFQNRVVSMGLNIGMEVRILQGGKCRPGPVLLAVGESRIAIGAGMADKVMVAVDPE